MSKETELSKRISKIENNDPSLTQFSVGPNEGLNSDHLTRIVQGIANNTYLEECNLKKTGLTTEQAIILAESLKKNTALRKLDLEDNAIRPEGIIALAQALKENATLHEIRLNGQKTAFGNEAETELADMMEFNTTLEKIVVSIKNGGARVRINKFETRNKEYNRRRRKGENIPTHIGSVASSSSTTTTSTPKPTTTTTTSSSSAPTSKPSTTVSTTTTTTTTTSSSSSNDAQVKQLQERIKNLEQQLENERKLMIQTLEKMVGPKIAQLESAIASLEKSLN